MRKISTLFVVFFAFFFFGCSESSSTKSYIEQEDLSIYYQNPRFIDSFSYPPSDPYYSSSWHIYPDSLGENRDINITSLWQAGYTGKNIKVGIIDYGFNPKHEDLVHAYYIQLNSDNDKDVTPDNEQHHGNQCAGIIGARSNPKGSLGVAPSSKLILIQSSIDEDTNNLINSSDTIKALEKAKDLGVDVLSNSWGSYSVSEGVENTLNYLSTEGRNGKGMILLFASGNDSCDMDAYCKNIGINPNDESEVESVIGVGAINKSNEKAYFSNYGEKLDIVAPGVDIFTTSFLDTYVSNSVDGTSFSAPIVAGVVANILQANPNLTLAQVKEVLYSSTLKINDSTTALDDYNSSGHSKYFGYGKVDAGSALEYLKNSYGVQ